MLASLLLIAFITLAEAQFYRGIYYWTWTQSGFSVSNFNFGKHLSILHSNIFLSCLFVYMVIGVAFSGWADPANALQESNSVKSNLPSFKWISLGGGNDNGKFTSSVLSTINSAIQSGEFSGWTGIVFDIETGDSGLYSSFAQCFQSASSQGLDIIVTVSHSAPYGIDDAASLMQSILSDGNVKYISPQLYTTGTESSNDYSTTQGVDWSAYKNTNAVLIPSIVQSSFYDDAASHFASLGLTTQGFIQWQQSA